MTSQQKLCYKQSSVVTFTFIHTSKFCLLYWTASKLAHLLDTASKFALFSVSGLVDEKLINMRTYMKHETCKLYSRVFLIFVPNIIKIDPCNFWAIPFQSWVVIFETLCILRLPAMKVYLHRIVISWRCFDNRVLESWCGAVKPSVYSRSSVVHGGDCFVTCRERLAGRCLAVCHCCSSSHSVTRGSATAFLEVDCLPLKAASLGSVRGCVLGALNVYYGRSLIPPVTGVTPFLVM